MCTIVIELYIQNVYTEVMEPRITKKLISLRVEPAVLAWFRMQTGRGYQTVMNAVLEKHVDEQRSLANRRAGRAQEIFIKFHAQCFWHLAPNLKITPENIQIVIDGLRKFGGRSGLVLAEELCR